jgi:RimJ/RimL family protein N-acetyltransferase
MLPSLIIEPAGYPSELDDCVTLPNQRRVHIRALRRGEDGPIRELYAHLSPRSRYLRFFSSTVPDSVIRQLARVDYHQQLALVAEHEVGSAREIVGLGSFGAVDATSVEVGLVVRDDWQRQRVGTALASRVLQAAESRGYRRFIAYLLPNNVAVRRLLKNVGEVVSSNRSGGMSEVAFVRRVSSN